MLTSFPWPDGMRMLGKGDSTLDAAFSHQLVAALIEQINADKNPSATAAPRGGGVMPPAGFRRFSFVNKGVSGQTLAAMNATLAAQITQYQPTHHLCACGINDIQTGVPLGTSQTQFTAYLDATAGVGKPTLFFLPFYWTGLGASVVTFNAAMTAIATAHAGAANIMLIDQYAALNAAVNFANYTSPDTDQAHHNPAARAAIAALVRPLISI